MTLTPLDYVYLIALAMLIVGELIAVIAHDPNKPTITSRVVRWLKQNPTKRRVILLLLLVWLTYHWLWQSF